MAHPWVRRATRVLWLVVGCGLLALFALYVWPTPYRYDHVTVDGDLVPVRIDRVSGDAEMLLPDQGWVPMRAEDDGSSSSKGEGTI